MLWPGRTGRTGTQRQKHQQDFIARDKEGICTGIFLAGESVVKSKFPRLSPQVAVVQEPARGEVVSPLQRALALLSCTVPVFSLAKEWKVGLL